MKFVERASPFNPLDEQTPDTAAVLEQREPGGLGIHLVRALSQKCTYERIDGCNTIVVELPRE